MPILYIISSLIEAFRDKLGNTSLAKEGLLAMLQHSAVVQGRTIYEFNEFVRFQLLREAPFYLYSPIISQVNNCLSKDNKYQLTHVEPLNMYEEKLT